MGQWSKLPMDLLNLVEGHLILYIDKIRIRAICRDWNSCLPQLPNYQVKQFPWLLHPLDRTEASHGLFNPIDKKVYEIYLPEARGKLFKGSSYGWLVTVEDIHSSSPTAMNLLNPLTMAQIALPPRTEFADVVQYRPNEVNEEFVIRMWYDMPAADFDDMNEENFVDEDVMCSYDVCVDLTWKVVLSSAPCDECVVVAIYGQSRQLAWCRLNNGKWTHVYACISGIIDIMFHKGKLHALTRHGELFVFEHIGIDLDTKVTEIASEVPIPYRETAYLAVCSNGGLIVVGRLFEVKRSPKSSLQTMGFNVYKIDLLNSSWVEVKNIGDDILVLGFNSSFSISSRYLHGHKGNHIYFSDSDDEMKSYDLDIGIFNLEDGTLELLPGLRQPLWPRPIWINIG